MIEFEPTEAIKDKAKKKQNVKKNICKKLNIKFE